MPVIAVERGNRVTMVDSEDSKEIKTGINDGTMVEIISGLSEGDEVVIKEFQSSNLMDQMRKMGQNRGMMGGGMSGGGAPSGGMSENRMPSGGAPSGGMSGGGMSGGR